MWRRCGVVADGSRCGVFRGVAVIGSVAADSGKHFTKCGVSVVAHNKMWDELRMNIASVPVGVTLAHPTVTASAAFASLAEDVRPSAVIAHGRALTATLLIAPGTGDLISADVPGYWGLPGEVSVVVMSVLEVVDAKVPPSGSAS